MPITPTGKVETQNNRTEEDDQTGATFNQPLEYALCINSPNLKDNMESWIPHLQSGSISTLDENQSVSLFGKTKAKDSNAFDPGYHIRQPTRGSDSCSCIEYPTVIVPKKMFTPQPQRLDHLAYFIDKRIRELFGNPKSYAAVKSSPKFSKAVAGVFSVVIPSIAAEVSPFDFAPDDVERDASFCKPSIWMC